ncbi:MAG: YbaN family protein [Eggerthellaceae bacterium]|nr:YbaN family protein [Eggerthellaceae bacterium]
MSAVIRYIMLGFAWICFATGCIGVFIPVLPTTPLLLLATFLFARYSPRLHDWICSTKVYRNYVAAFKAAGGVPLVSKVRILAISYSVMLLSAIAVQKVHVWGILLCVAIFLLWLMFVRIPTISRDKVEEVREHEGACNLEADRAREADSECEANRACEEA